MDETAETQRVVQFTQYVNKTRRAPENAIIKVAPRITGMRTRGTMQSKLKHQQYVIDNTNERISWKCLLAIADTLYNQMPSTLSDYTNMKTLHVAYLQHIRFHSKLTYI